MSGKSNEGPEVVVGLKKDVAEYLLNHIQEDMELSLKLMIRLHRRSNPTATEQRHMVKLVTQTQNWSAVMKALKEGINGTGT